MDGIEVGARGTVASSGSPFDGALVEVVAVLDGGRVEARLVGFGSGATVTIPFGGFVAR